MSIVDLLFFLLIAGIIGAVGQSIAGYSVGGCLISVILGYAGALLGGWLARNLGLPDLLNLNVGGTSFPVIWSVIGSSLLVAVVGLLTRPRVA
jgi:uncharacterized membrane protein YeaQ/YmgE (transglycosylase-associated protein family)